MKHQNLSIRFRGSSRLLEEKVLYVATEENVDCIESEIKVMKPLPAWIRPLNLKRFFSPLAAAFIVLFVHVHDVSAEIPARLRKIDVRPAADYTRLILKLDRETDYSVTELPGQRFRVTLSHADGPLFRKLRGYSDQHINGITVGQRGERLHVTIGARSGEGFRVIGSSTQLLAVDVGARFNSGRTSSHILPGREEIWNGAGRFVREYDPALKSDLPFSPTDRQSLKALLAEDQARLFLQGEAALYKGWAAEAAAVFEAFLKSDSAVRALAAYRCAEARYILQDYRQALDLFREGERLWPQFLANNPAVAFCYADSLVRSGDLPTGRRLLTALIASQADKQSAPTLLVRLADILARQKHEQEALLIYRNVVSFFPNNKAAGHAALKLADWRFLNVDSSSYAGLRDEYSTISKQTIDFVVREEALFKAALLDALFGQGLEALQSVSAFEKRYPRGVFTSIARSMHEQLMPGVCRERIAAEDREGLAAVVEGHADYLAHCMADSAFIAEVDKAYASLGRLQEQNRLFAKLVRREWASEHAPFMYSRMMDNAVALADWGSAEKTGQEFLQRFPSHPAAPTARELLGDVAYRNGDFAAVRDNLAWLLQPKSRATHPESYYYLGKALESERQPKLSGAAMERFLAALRERGDSSSPLAADAQFVAGMSYLAAGNAGRALASFRSGLVLAPVDSRDRFLYRIGEISLREGRAAEARNSWDKIVREGNDAGWQRLAAQAMADLDFRQRTGSRI